MPSTSSSARDSLCEFKQNINVLPFSILETRSSKYLSSPSPAICLFYLHSGAKKTHRHDLVKTQVQFFIPTGVQDPGDSVTSLLLVSAKETSSSWIKRKVFTLTLGTKFLFCEVGRPSDLPRKDFKTPKLLLFEVMSQITPKSWFFRTNTSSILPVIYSSITCTIQSLSGDSYTREKEKVIRLQATACLKTVSKEKKQLLNTTYVQVTSWMTWQPSLFIPIQILSTILIYKGSNLV